MTVLTHFGILAISWVRSIGLKWFLSHLKLTHSFTFHTLKSISWVFLIKQSNHSRAFTLSKAETRNWSVKSILVIYQSTEIKITWFLMHWKANSKGRNFRVCTKASSASTIQKILVKIGAKIEQCWKLIRKMQICRRGNTRVQYVTSTPIWRVCIHILAALQLELVVL